MKKQEKKVIEKSFSRKEIIIRKIDYMNWLDGMDLWWKIPRDDRPDFNPYYYFDGHDESIYGRLITMADYYIDEVPDELKEALEEFKLLSKITDKYANHILGLILKIKEKELKN